MVPACRSLRMVSRSTTRNTNLSRLGQSFASTVVPGVTHQRVVSTGKALTHQEGATHHLRVQVIRRLQDGLGRHRAEMVCGQWGKETIHPQRAERSIGLLKVEGD